MTDENQTATEVIKADAATEAGFRTGFYKGVLAAAQAVDTGAGIGDFHKWAAALSEWRFKRGSSAPPTLKDLRRRDHLEHTRQGCLRTAEQAIDEAMPELRQTLYQVSFESHKAGVADGERLQVKLIVFSQAVADAVNARKDTLANSISSAIISEPPLFNVHVILTVEVEATPY